jgi:preprotein translocase subunit SecB
MTTQPLVIQRVYVKDLSFEIPSLHWGIAWDPQVDLQIKTISHPFNTNDTVPNTFEVILMIHVSLKNNDVVAVMIELQQAGIFTLTIPEENMHPALGIACPAILLPYARVLVSHLLTDSGFPSFILPVIQFDLLYAEQFSKT